MFNWATEKLEQLSQTVAPPPDDPASRFVYCVQKNDEAGAQGTLAEMDPLHTIVQPTKGTTPLHLACAHSMVNLIRQIMAIPGASLEITDAAGNTPLHHASMSTDQANGVYVVKMLITEYSASVVAKNWAGQTPYDIATLNSIRQYLLPIQLQQETQQAIDNGGVGLPPGIDMGGIRISQPAMAPPPIGGMGAGPLPPTPLSAASPPQMLATPSPNMPPSTHTTVPPPAVQQPEAPHSGNATATAPTPAGNDKVEQQQPTSAPTSGNNRTYSRSGSSSAAVLSKAKFRPDGFHSSSSDVSLQKKYGHSSHGTPAAAVPPPPSSGNSAGPPTASSSGANPYAAGSSAFGSANRYGGGAATSRYPVAYGATPVAPSSGGYSGMQRPNNAAPVPSYAVFQPGVASQTQAQQQQPAYQQQSYPSDAQQQQQPATPFMSPPPYQQQQPTQQAAYPQPAVTQQQQPPPQMNAFQQPQTTYQQQPPAQPVVTSQEQPPPMPGPPYPMAHAVSSGNASTASAEEVFASPNKTKEMTPAVPAAEPATRTVTQDSAKSSISSAQELFATSATAGEASANDAGTQEQPTVSENNYEEQEATSEPTVSATEPIPQQSAETPVEPAKTTAADFFGGNGASESTPVEPPKSNPMEDKEKEDTGESADGLDDVPLEEVPLTPSDGSANGPGAGQAAALASVGLPPPPFSSRQ